MEFKDLLKELAALNLPKNEFAITASGCLAVRGLRKASDLDIIVTDNLWNELAKKYPVTFGLPCDVIRIGKIEFLGNFSVYTDEKIANVKEQIDTADIIDGIRFVKLSLIKKFKEKLARDKDLKDIKLIDNYLQTDNNHLF